MEKIYKLLKLLIWVLAFAVVIVGASLLYNRLSGEMALGGIATTPKAAEHTGETAAQPNMAPDFTAYDLEGNAHKLSDFLGKPVILNFWASWCGPCKAEMPDLEAAYLAYGEEICFLTVNLTDGRSETVESASAYIAQEGYTFPVFFDTDQETATQCGISSIPATFFIDACGGGVVLDLLSVLVSTRAEENVVSAQSSVARDGVGSNSLVGVTDMGLFGCVCNRGSDIVFRFIHCQSLPFCLFVILFPRRRRKRGSRLFFCFFHQKWV